MKPLYIVVIVIAALLILWGAYAYSATVTGENNYIDPEDVTPLDMAGGLYPDGSNYPTGEHMTNYISATNEIYPRNIAGDESTSGRIGFLSVGASNPVKEWDAFVSICISDPFVSEHIDFINGCIGGVSYEDMLSGTSAAGDYFSRLVKAAQAEGVTPEQIQAIWIKSDSLSLDMWSMSQDDYVNYFADQLSGVLQRLYTTFPNVKVVYTSGRNQPYLDETSDNWDKHGGPRAYFNQLGIREVIRRQSEGELITSGPDQECPVLIWVSPLYTDPHGCPNSYGHVWDSVDVVGDGVHPTDAGAEKVAQYLYTGFSADEHARKWLFA